MDLKGQEISSGNAAKIAADLVAVAAQTGADLDSLIGLWTQAHSTVAELLITTTDQLVQPSGQAPAPAFDAQTSIEQTFPGTTVVAPPSTPAPTNVVQLPPVSPAPASAPAPAPIPNVASSVDPQIEMNHRQFLADIASGAWESNWEDNREKKAQGGKFAKIPDFQHRHQKTPDGKWNIGIYLTDKKVSDDIKSQYQALGLVS